MTVSVQYKMSGMQRVLGYSYYDSAATAGCKIAECLPVKRRNRRIQENAQRLILYEVKFLAPEIRISFIILDHRVYYSPNRFRQFSIICFMIKFKFSWRHRMNPLTGSLI